MLLLSTCTARNTHCRGRGLCLALFRRSGSLPCLIRSHRSIANTPTSRAQSKHQIHEADDRIFPESLEKTLRAHQEQNDTTAIIRNTKGVATHHPTRREGTILKRKDKFGNAGPGYFSNLRRVEFQRDAIHQGAGSWVEYSGEARPLTTEWSPSPLLPRYLQYPWLRELESSTNPQPQQRALQRLNAEIKAYDAYLSPTKAEKLAVEAAVNDVHSAIANAASQVVKLGVVGSRANGLASPLSDIDLNLVLNSKGVKDPHKLSYEILAKFFRQLKYPKTSTSRPKKLNAHYFLSRARVPIVSGSHLPSGMEFQVNCIADSYDTLQYSKSIVAVFPTLRPLFKVIKHMLVMRNLSVGPLGGLTSYPLLNMIITTLKLNAARTDPLDAATQLLQFFDFFTSIDFYTTGIAHEPSKYIQQRENLTPLQNADGLWSNHPELVAQDPVGAIPFMFSVAGNYGEVHHRNKSYQMVLLDPANPHNDLGSGAKVIKHIQATFMEARENLAHAIERWDAPVRDPKTGHYFLKPQGDRPEPLLACILGGDYTLFTQERKRLVRYGKQEARKAEQNLVAEVLS